MLSALACRAVGRRVPSGGKARQSFNSAAGATNMVRTKDDELNRLRFVPTAASHMPRSPRSQRCRRCRDSLPLGVRGVFDASLVAMAPC